MARRTCSSPLRGARGEGSISSGLKLEVNDVALDLDLIDGTLGLDLLEPQTARLRRKHDDVPCFFRTIFKLECGSRA